MKEMGMVKVWDPLVRAFHWGVVLAFGVAFFTEFETLGLHVYAGYMVAALLAARVAWGLSESAGAARFSGFLYSPGAVLAHLKDMARLRAGRYLGHNPAAGAMAVALMSLLAATVLTGFMTYGAKEVSGPFAPILLGVGWRWGGALEDIHHFLAKATLVFAAAHVTGAVVESLVHGENLIVAMITGYKRTQPIEETER
ncbi:MAG: cytochrome b/b6 domain-containing protein [Candidatus Nitrospinota bacterium M3_3B_026]